MAEKWVGIGHGKIERERLTGNLDIQLVSACFCGGAVLEPTAAEVGIARVIHGRAGRQKHAPADFLDDRFHRLHGATPTGGHLNNTAFGCAYRLC